VGVVGLVYDEGVIMVGRVIDKAKDIRIERLRGNHPQDDILHSLNSPSCCMCGCLFLMQLE
jgi:hypothetical protein